MQNPFKKASQTNKRLKIFLFGDSGVGKTRLALRFPKPCVLDLEGGTDLYSSEFEFDVVKSTSADEIMNTVSYLAANRGAGYQTLIIDPITIYWEALQKKYTDFFLQRNRKSAGYRGEFYILQPQDWNVIKSEWKDFIRKILSLDMNVVCTAREKAQYKDGEFMVRDGETFDGERSLPYFFDTVIHVSRRGEKSSCEVRKDRTNTLPKSFQTSYEVFEKILAHPESQAKADQAQEQKPEKSISEEQLYEDLEDDFSWMDKPIGTKAANGSSWEAMALNLAWVEKDGARVTGRQYLNAIRVWDQASPEMKAKATIALENYAPESPTVEEPPAVEEATEETGVADSAAGD